MKIRIIVIFSMALLWVTSSQAQNLLKKVEEQQSLELAYYSIKPEKNDTFQQLKERTFRALKKQPGLVAIHSYQDVSKPNQYIDIVIWETLDNARKAEQNFVTLPEFKDYNASLEKVMLYSHGEMLKDGQVIKSAISDESIMEFVAYTIRDNEFENYEAARSKVVDVLSKKYDGFESARTWKSVEQSNMVMDVFFWRDLETARKAFQESGAMPEFQPFNKTIGQIKFFGDYKKVY